MGKKDHENTKDGTTNKTDDEGFRGFVQSPGPWRTLSNHRVAPRSLTKPCGTQLGSALLSFKVHVDKPEALAEAVDPLEVVHCAPLKVTLHWHAFGRGAPQLSEVIA